MSENETNNSESTETANLPDIVRRVGGDLELVISNLPAYVDERFPLSEAKQKHLAKIIENNPRLNNENDISNLIDILSYHGVTREQLSTERFNALIENYSVQDLSTAFNYLYEIGIRDRGDANEDSKVSDTDKEINDSDSDEATYDTSDLVFVFAVLNRIRELRANGKKVITTEVLDAKTWDINDYIQEEDQGRYHYTGGLLGTPETTLELDEEEMEPEI
ncbi:MAG: hypothetical protein RJA41_665 [Actinomycetota bacterium]